MQICSPHTVHYCGAWYDSKCVIYSLFYPFLWSFVSLFSFFLRFFNVSIVEKNIQNPYHHTASTVAGVFINPAHHVSMVLMTQFSICSILKLQNECLNIHKRRKGVSERVCCLNKKIGGIYCQMFNIKIMIFSNEFDYIFS